MTEAGYSSGWPTEWLETESQTMNILLLGSGGREHALAWKISQSPRLKKLFIAPGSDAMAKLGDCVKLDPCNSDQLPQFSKSNKIQLLVVGPEAPLVAGVADAFWKVGIPVFGPTSNGAQMEASKAFTKELCSESNIPTASYETFEEAGPAKEYLKKQKFPIVIKADGLAAGKGVIIAENFSQGEEAVEEILVKKNLGSQSKLVIESFLYGEEASFMVVTDGKTALPLATSQDHKRIFDGDKGPNTGGMGAYSPAPLVTPTVFDRTMKEIIQPTLDGLRKQGIDYKGVMYAGLMIEHEIPSLLEYNVRFGDPECEVILPRMKSDLVDLMLATVEDRLSDFKLQWHEKSCVGVVLAAEGYPGTPTKGDRIEGIEEAEKLDQVKVFHAGTILKEGKWITNGGRVLVMTALGNTLQEAVDQVYKAVSKISWRGMQYRKDIAAKELARKEIP